MAVQVVAVSTVGRFLVGDTHLVGGSQAAPVYPPGFIKSVCGGPICGDGHLCLGQPSGQFGTPTFTVSSAQSKAVTGLASAQAFGTATVKAVYLRTVTGLGSAQSFGTLRFRVSAPTGGVNTAQAFGVPGVKTAITRTVGAVSSAQSFGTATAKSVFLRSVTGLGSPQAFGTITTKTAFKLTPTGLASGQAFGALAFKTTVTRTVSGLGSAQAFGSIVAAVPVRPGGVSTAQAFGAPRTKVAFQVAGLTSAQNFGTPTVPQRFTIAGVGTAGRFGQPLAFVVYLHGSTCIDLILEQEFCLQPGASILNTFLCGQRTVAAPEAMLDLDCLTSPEPSICGFPICGDGHVCGGMPYTAVEDCLPLDLSPTPPLILDLTPAGVS